MMKVKVSVQMWTSEGQKKVGYLYCLRQLVTITFSVRILYPRIHNGI
jgi:hypothetical protein